jgi:hypothetical protein
LLRADTMSAREGLQQRVALLRAVKFLSALEDSAVGFSPSGNLDALH